MKTFECVCFAIVCLVCPGFVIAHDEGFDTEAIQEFLHRNFDGKNTGMVIGIVDEHSSQVFAAGKLDNGTDQEMNGDTLFEIGSVTKTFTVLLLEDMVNRGDMKLDDPVENYLPKSVKVPSHGGKQITLLNLAAQDSGLPHDADNMAPRDPNNLFAEYTAEDLYAFLSKYSLDKDPGTEFRYSNAGMSLLGHAIELKIGSDFESLVVERICTPLGMESTRVIIPADAKTRLAIGHDERGKPQPGMTFHVVAPAGALRSTANDMLKYVSANAGLKTSTLTPLMQRMHVIRHADALVFGATAMPWYDAHAFQPSGMDLRGHAGGTNGFSTFAGFDIKHHRGVVVLSNSDASSIRSSGVGWRILQQASLKSTNAATAEPVIEIVGIGTAIAIDGDTKTLRISKIIPNSPAALAGLASGSIIQKIDDTQTIGLSVEECRKLLGGPAGSKVRLAIVDSKGSDSKTVQLTRQKFLISS